MAYRVRITHATRTVNFDVGPLIFVDCLSDQHWNLLFALGLNVPVSSRVPSLLLLQFHCGLGFARHPQFTSHMQWKLFLNKCSQFLSLEHKSGKLVLVLKLILGKMILFIFQALTMQPRGGRVWKLVDSVLCNLKWNGFYVPRLS